MVLYSHPFIAVDGVFNFRDIGGYASSQDPTLSVRRGYIFRCAHPGNITPTGSQKIRDLGITKIFDLRSMIEIERTADFGPLQDIAGVDRVSVPVYLESEYPSHQSVRNLENYINRNDAKSAYVDILAEGGPAFRTLFLHLRDAPSEACLIHCAAGKDRTGVAVALILAVAGVDDASITREYRLTEEGLKAMRPSVIRYLNKKSGPEWTEEQVSKLLDVSMDAMAQMLHVLHNEYQGADGYLKSQCGFSDHDIATVKGNLLARLA